MAKIDGFTVNMGDPVYDIILGAGQVTGMHSGGSFVVKIGSSESVYRDGGYFGNSRRLYWSDPIVILPPKNRRVWSAYKSMTIKMYDMLKTLFQIEGVDAKTSDKV